MSIAIPLKKKNHTEICNRTDNQIKNVLLINNKIQSYNVPTLM